MPAVFDPLEFVRRHGVVLASGQGPVPNVADAVAGESIRGTWWAHPASHAIFAALTAIDDAPDVLCLRWVRGKITFVHRRLWPALVRLADALGADALTAVKQEHTESGAHRNVLTPFPQWVPPEVKTAARALSEEEARAQIGAWLATEPAAKTQRKGKKKKTKARTPKR